MADYDVPITGIDEAIIDAVYLQLFQAFPQRLMLGVNPYSAAEIQYEKRHDNG